MMYEEKMMRVLSSLPCPVSKEPGAGGDTYCVFNLAGGKFDAFASNKPRRVRWPVQVHVFSRLDDGTCEDLFDRALRLLLDAGLTPYGISGDLYERDTGYHHLACTCQVIEKMKEETNNG